MTSAAHSPASALVAHAENAIVDGRVLVIGNASHLLSAHLLERGARLVQVLDPDAKRVAHAAAHNSERRLSFSQLTDNSLRDASFDCAIVEDLGGSSDPKKLLAGVRRSLGAEGVAVIATTNAESTSGLLGSTRGTITFDALDELTAEVFDASLLLGQSPFIGYSVVSLELDAPPEPSLDNGFLGGGADQADFYVAICGTEEALASVELDDMTIVQLPAGRMLDDGVEAERRQERRAVARANQLEAELKALRQKSSAHEVERLTSELEQRDSWIRELEARAESADARADDAEAETEHLRTELKGESADPEELRRTREKLDEIQRVATRSQKEAKWAEDRVRKLERELESALHAAEEAEKNATPDNTDEVNALRRDLEKLDKKLARKKDTLHELQKSYEDQETELEETHAELLKAIKLKKAAEQKLSEKKATDSDEAKKAKDSAEASNKKKLAALQKLLDQATSDAETAEAEAEQAEAELAKLKSKPPAASADLGKLKSKLEKLEKDHTKLEKKLKLEGERASAAEQDLGEAESDVKSLNKRLEKAEKAAHKAEKAADKARHDKPKQDKPRHEQSSKRHSSDQGDAKESARLEAQLRERGSHVLELQKQLSDLQTFAQSLKAEMKLQTSDDDGGSAERVDHLEKSLAEREADLVAAEWTIGQLQQRLQNTVG